MLLIHYYMATKNGRFRCTSCGDRFDLKDKDELELFEEGHYDHEPDTCDLCIGLTYDTYIDSYSDADPGL